MEENLDSGALDLVFRSIHDEDKGEYACHAIIDNEPASSKFELNVIGKMLD